MSLHAPKRTGAINHCFQHWRIQGSHIFVFLTVSWGQEIHTLLFSSQATWERCIMPFIPLTEVGSSNPRGQHNWLTVSLCHSVWLNFPHPQLTSSFRVVFIKRAKVSISEFLSSFIISLKHSVFKKTLFPFMHVNQGSLCSEAVRKTGHTCLWKGMGEPWGNQEDSCKTKKKKEENQGLVSGTTLEVPSGAESSPVLEV